MLNLSYEPVFGIPRRRYGVTRNGEVVYSKPQGKPCHVESHPEVHEHYELALQMVDSSQIPLDGEEVFVIDLGTPYAVCTLVEVEENDPNVFYARRDDRRGLSRLIVGREPSPCSKMVIVLYRNPKGILVASTAFAGNAPSTVEPWDPKAKGNEEACRNFWKIRALIVSERPQDAIPYDPTYWIPLDPLPKQ